MDLFNTAKGLMGNGGGNGGMNPIAMFKSLDKNGDGKITESGNNNNNCKDENNTFLSQKYDQNFCFKILFKWCNKWALVLSVSK
jgi:hypothetical protein